MEDLIALIEGSYLGDGSFSKRYGKNGNSRMSFGHSEKQLDYLRWKIDILKKYQLSTGVITKVVQKSSRYKTGECTTYHAVSRANRIFSYYRNKYYPNGKKILLPFDMVLSPMCLAIWFMDDGNKCTRSYQINTQSFSSTSLQYMCHALKEKYDLDFTVDKNNVLYLRTSSIAKFESLIKPYMPECMRYKLRVLDKEEELLES